MRGEEGSFAIPAQVGETDLGQPESSFSTAGAESLEPLYPISTDGPHPICDHRRWLARQLMDSRNDDATAYGIVAHSPAIKGAM